MLLVVLIRINRIVNSGRIVRLRSVQRKLLNYLRYSVTLQLVSVLSGIRLVNLLGQKVVILVSGERYERSYSRRLFVKVILVRLRVY